MRGLKAELEYPSHVRALNTTLGTHSCKRETMAMNSKEDEDGWEMRCHINRQEIVLMVEARIPPSNVFHFLIAYTTGLQPSKCILKMDNAHWSWGPQGLGWRTIQVIMWVYYGYWYGYSCRPVSVGPLKKLFIGPARVCVGTHGGSSEDSETSEPGETS